MKTNPKLKSESEGGRNEEDTRLRKSDREVNERNRGESRMKVTAIISVIVLAALIGTRVDAGDRTFGDGTLPSFLEAYDVDGDGVLSEEERQAMKEAREAARAEWIAQWDADGDGVLSEEEKAAAREAMQAKIEETRTERFNEADADGDGLLSMEEFLALPGIAKIAEEDPDKPALIFDRLDTDDEDGISLEEFLARMRRKRPHRPRPRPRPGDGDGHHHGDPPPPDGGGEDGGDPPEGE